jgi:lipooligosaccharide transport system permease protein
MFFLSGTFFPLDSIPIYLRWIGWISPLWHATDLGRYITYGHQISTQLLWIHIIFLVSMVFVGLKLSFVLFEKRLAK